jgi:GT2 family glycosyltransferase
MRSEGPLRFSIIIPTYNRPVQLTVCLGALALLAEPDDGVEVIVVDDGGEAPLDAVVAPFSQKLRLKLLRQANAGPGAARNAGAREARGEYLAFTDDDCAPAADWLRELAAAFAKHPGCLVGGRTANSLTDNLYSATSQLIVDIVYRHHNANPQQARFFASNNLALPALRFAELGGFDPSFRTSEDRELCDRWLHRGGRMVFAERAVVYHAHPLSLYSFCRQHYSYGQGAYRYHKLRAHRGSGSFTEATRFHLNFDNWLLYPFRMKRWPQALSLAGTLALWQLCNALGFTMEALHRSSPSTYSVLSK